MYVADVSEGRASCHGAACCFCITYPEYNVFDVNVKVLIVPTHLSEDNWTTRNGIFKIISRKGESLALREANFREPSHARGRRPANSRCPPVKLSPVLLCRQLLLGHRYGSRPVPSVITAKEFLLLRDVIKSSEADVTLLDTWYKCDENALPPEYILQPISSILTNYCNKVSLSPLFFR